MRNLREKLKAVSSAPPSTKQKEVQASAEPFYVREHQVPLHDLRGFELTTLEEICACDPTFSGTTWDIHKLLFLDTETTGLSGGAGTVAFEIGVGFIRGSSMIIRQYVMRDYGEESAMLSDLAMLIGQFNTLITFNGKTFDIPLLESRLIMQRIRLRLSDLPHFDLLHACRRVYKLRLKRCNLSALEEAVLGQTRNDDLPGALVPQRYFDYLKTREFALLEDVLRHNKQDVQSLASLTGHLCKAFRAPDQILHPEDLYSVGYTLERGGRIDSARNCYKILGHSSLSAQAHMRLSVTYKRERDWDDALTHWQNMIVRREGGTWPYIETAKYYEHVEKDIIKALHYANAALSYELNTMMLHPTGKFDSLDALHKRIDRLIRKRSKLHD